jgi:alkylation response protein AidB-like acyl-CoA dehydrogenase
VIDSARREIVLRDARRLADELFGRALATDAADIVPKKNLDLLADGGYYGLAGPPEAGGMGIDLATGQDVIEILAAGCLTTTFVWLQHHGAVFAVSTAAPPALRDEWLEPLCRGARRSGVAFAGLLPGDPILTATPDGDHWILNGVAPWVTGWGRIDLIHVAARAGQDVVWMLVDPSESDALRVERLPLVAVNASATVTLRFDGLRVPVARVTHREPHAAQLARDAERLRLNGSLALGVAGRCCALMGTGPLDQQLAGSRETLDRATPETLPAARASASELALRAAARLIVDAGARSIVMDHHAQRLAREALFLLVFASRSSIKRELLTRL